MKRFLLLVFAVVFLCTLAVIASADEPVPVTDTYYLVQSLDSEAALALANRGETNVVIYEDLISSTGTDVKDSFFCQFSDGDHIEIILAEDIFVPKTLVPSNTGILINKAITVTIKYNGFCHYLDNSGGTSFNGIVLRNKGALIRLIGTKAIDLEGGKISSSFTTPTGDIAEGNFNTTGCNLDIFKYADAYVTIVDGNTYCENIRSYSGKAIILTSSGADSVHELVNCAVKGGNEYSVELMGQNRKTIKIDGGYYQGIECNTTMTGSYIKNATIVDEGIHMDCWSVTGQVWLFEKCSISKIQTASGRTDFLLIDCTYDPSSSSLGSDGGGKTVVVSVTTATCQRGASVKVYANGNSEYSYENFLADSGSSIKGNTQSSLAKEEYRVVTGVPLEHSASVTDCTKDILCDMCKEAVVYEKQFDTHDTYIVAITYKNGFSSAGERLVKCKNCISGDKTEQTLPLFDPQGYTINDNQTGFGTGFRVNKEALESYEAVNDVTVTFGIMVFNPKYLGDEAFLNGGFVNATKGALQVSIDRSYVNCKLLVSGFTSLNYDMELVFAGYAYENDLENIQIMQKTYKGNESSPMSHKITRGSDILYTVKIEAIINPQIMPSKENLLEYVAN